MQLADTDIPTNLVICEKDRVLPHPRYTKHFLKHIPDIDRVTTLPNVGHIPMFEAPQTITDLIMAWVEEHSSPVRQAPGLDLARQPQPGLRRDVRRGWPGTARWSARAGPGRSAARGPWSSCRPRRPR